MALLEAKGVKAYYYVRKNQVKAVDGVDLVIEKGITLGLAGESGCGKSTLVNTLMMNVKPPLHLVSGTIALDGKLISNMNRSTLKKSTWGVLVSLVPQSALNALMPTKRIGGFMRDAIGYHLSISKFAILSMAKKEFEKLIRDVVSQDMSVSKFAILSMAKKRFEKLIRDVVSQDMSVSKFAILSMAKKRFEELNLPMEVLSMYPHELSGGMKQRAVIAISTLLNPKLLIVDEPTSALDVCCQKMVLRMLLDLKETGITESVVFVTHDIAVLNQIADWIIIMYAGKIVESAPTDDMLNDPRHPYTYSLINAVVTPEPEVKKRGMTSIPGEPPNLIDPPKGCRFHPRCPYMSEKCVREVPPLYERTKGRFTSCHYEIDFQKGVRLNEIDYGGSAAKG